LSAILVPATLAGRNVRAAKPIVYNN
jgi:hypothetical protein